jgi:transcription antitermination protein NusB
MSRRSRAREIVMQVLFQDDLNPRHDLLQTDQFLAERLQQNEELITFGKTLLAGVRRNRPELDKLLTDLADNWSLIRMAVTDRNVLRLGAYEILFTDTPGPVVINEAVDLAKRYGTKHSGPFVNGILDRVQKRKKETL